MRLCSLPKNYCVSTVHNRYPGMKTDIYADALIAMTERGANPKEAVAAFKRYAEARGMHGVMARLPAILDRRESAHKRRHEVAVSVAHERDAAHAKREAAEQMKELGVDTHAVHVRLDDTLIGGWRMEAHNTLIDNSFKKHLMSLYASIIR